VFLNRRFFIFTVTPLNVSLQTTSAGATTRLLLPRRERRNMQYKTAFVSRSAENHREQKSGGENRIVRER